MSNELKNIFISHVHEDDSTLPELRELLKGRDVDIRDYSINSGKPNDATNENYIKYDILAPRIQAASAVAVLINKETHDSWWVNWEIEYAQKLGKPIIGIYARGGQESDLPEAFELYGDALVGWQAERIIDALDGKVQNWRTPSDLPIPDRDIPRYHCT